MPSPHSLDSRRAKPYNEGSRETKRSGVGKEGFPMFNFTYCAPTKVVFGRDTVSQVGQLAAQCGAKKVLVHFGGKSAKASGLLDRVCRSLEESGVAYVTLGGVQPNPRLSKVLEGIDLGRREGVDFLLPVGGGSVIDSAKAIGYGLANEGDVWDFYEGTREPAGCLPLGAVLTIAAAGSEMSNSSVITKDEGMLKRGCTSELCRCRFAVMDPELTFTLPDYQTACGCVDINMHTMERYFHGQQVKNELTDAFSEALMRTVIHNARILRENPRDYDARAEIMWAGSLAHNDLLNCGIQGRGDWACHQLEHELGGMFDVAHGAGLAAVWGSWARYVYQAAPSRFAGFALRVMGVEPGRDDQETALRGIEAYEAFLTEIGMPVNLPQLGLQVTDEQIDELVWKCSFLGKRTIGSFRVLDTEDMKAIYRMAR